MPNDKLKESLAPVMPLTEPSVEDAAEGLGDLMIDLEARRQESEFFKGRAQRYIKRRAKWQAKFRGEGGGEEEEEEDVEDDEPGGPDEAGIWIRPAVHADVADVHAMIMDLAILEKEPDQV